MSRYQKSAKQIRKKSDKEAMKLWCQPWENQIIQKVKRGFTCKNNHVIYFQAQIQIQKTRGIQFNPSLGLHQNSKLAIPNIFTPRSNMLINIRKHTNRKFMSFNLWDHWNTHQYILTPWKRILNMNPTK